MRISPVIRLRFPNANRRVSSHGCSCKTNANDGRKVAGWLPELQFGKGINPVIQVIEDKTGEILYTARAQNSRFQPRVYSKGKHTLKIGIQKPNAKTLKGFEPKAKKAAGRQRVTL